MRICVCSPSRDAYSETFIHGHIRLLPNVIPIYGDWPLIEHDGRAIIPSANRALSRYGGRVHGLVERLAHRQQIKTVAGFLKNQAITVVLAEYGYTGAVMMESCRQAGIPLVVHFHGVDAYHKETLDDHAESYPKMFELAAAIIAVSRDMEQQLLRLGARREKLFYNPYGIDLNAFLPAPVATNQPVFLSTGRFVDKKAPHLTMLAFERVLKNCPEAQLVYAGDGPLYDACRQLAQALGLTRNITFRGRQTHEQIAELMRQSRAFVQHSVTALNGDKEGTPVAILEAAGSALPVVATRHAGIPEAVLDGDTGFLVDELDFKTMAEHMTTLALDGTRAAAMGQEGRRHIMDHFQTAKSIQRLNEILEQACRH